MKNKAIPLIVALSLVFAGGSAYAISLFPGIGTTAGVQAEDDDIDFHVDTNDNGIIDVGDRLLSPLEFTRTIDILPPIHPTSPANLNTAADELTGLADITVIANIPGDPAGRIRFGPSGLTPMLNLYSLGPGIDFDATNCLTQAACVDAASDGTLWASFSVAEGDDEWFFDPLIGGANNPAAVATIPAATQVGIVNFALSLISNPSGVKFLDQDVPACGFIFQCNDNGLTELVGSANILGGLGLSAGFARSDTDITLNVVPEPASVALIGMALLGLGSMRRSRKAQLRTSRQ